MYSSFHKQNYNTHDAHYKKDVPVRNLRSVPRYQNKIDILPSVPSNKFLKEISFISIQISLTFVSHISVQTIGQTLLIDQFQWSLHVHASSGRSQSVYVLGPVTNMD